MNKRVKVRKLADKWRIIRSRRIVTTLVRTLSSATWDLTKTATSAETFVFNGNIGRNLLYDWR